MYMSEEKQLTSQNKKQLTKTGKRRMSDKLSAETENALLRMRMQMAEDITLAIEKQTIAINCIFTENKLEVEARFAALNLRISCVETKANNLLVKFAALSGSIGVVVWAANKFIQ